MSAGSKIEWTDATWSPVTGCDRVSAGCDNCYALTMAKRLKAMGQAKYQNDGDPRTSGPGFGLTTHADALAIPFKWRKPKRIFVNSMSDLFHDDVPSAFIAEVFAIMTLSPQHTFQVLTKRHARMRSLLGSDVFRAEVARFAIERAEAAPGRPYLPEEYVVTWGRSWWPLRNVWLGVSVEDQKWADIRIPALLETPAAVRWLSCEPLLGPVQLPLLNTVDACTCGHYGPHEPTCGLEPGPAWDQLHWVVVGGESGPGARPMDPEWVRSLRRQCERAGIPFFFKQWGEWCHSDQMPADTWMWLDQQINLGQQPHPEPHRVGKKWAGRLLDGRAWDEYPVGAGHTRKPSDVPTGGAE